MNKKQEILIEELGSYCMENGIRLSDLHELTKQKQLDVQYSEDEHIKNFHSVKDKIIRSGDIEIDFIRNLVYKGKRILNVHKNEFLILQMLVSNPKDVIGNEELIQLLKGHDLLVKNESLVVYVSRLSKLVGRSPIDEKYIKRMVRRGYYWSFSIHEKNLKTKV